MIGKEVYFVDLKDREIKIGTVVTDIISQSGYEVYVVLGVDGKKYSKDLPLVFETLEEAEEKLQDILKWSDEMEQYQKQTTETLDAMREKIIGKPNFKELANAIYGK